MSARRGNDISFPLRPSTGNDIVFLEATRPQRTRHPRFYSRILRPAEQKAYHGLDIPFDHYVWLCWSIKESAFKYHKRLCPDLVFAPLKIEVGKVVFADGYYESVVSVEGLCLLYSRSLILDGVIVTVVNDDNRFTGTRWGFRAIPSPAYADQHTAVRTAVLKELEDILLWDDLQIEKDPAGCPILLRAGHSMDLPISLAHHDRYIAWSFLL